MTEKRRQFTGEQKIAVLRRYLPEHVAVSDLCDEYREYSLGIQPSVFYRWQQQLFENDASAFEPRARRARDPLADKIKALEDKLTRKNEVLSELMEEHVKFRRAWGCLAQRRVPADTRDAVVDCLRYWSDAVDHLAGHPRQQVL
jgi:transposase-like protein